MTNSLYVSSPVNALVQGILREDKTLQQVLEHGNFGLGTFNDLDGEMVLVDGIFYQLRSDGSALIPDLNIGTPYACVTHFSPVQSFDTLKDGTYLDLQQVIIESILSNNLIYAIRIEGTFTRIRARSVPKQDAYRPLVNVANDQKEFEYEHISGQLVGFWTPDFMHSISVPGFHLHFLSADKSHGGHLLDFVIKAGKVWLQPLDQLSLDLPHTIEYLNANLEKDNSEDLNKAEH
ncbi:acetolactate decarboxylase [Polynucleobacter hirudinilacicola]|uniref:Alpha-acetolactate decarboxylase n=1 Tax=Polynucleobacter hirudinilacicola TaxID=1743166 RepID=A0A210RVZ5_9BURK|nr:acetolactate decarboxylase [Polynucleobacter hirudinilacicola]OWF65182.1 acetolactate decarboxylase [Polynucleobacter hirudinilacicola]